MSIFAERAHRVYYRTQVMPSTAYLPVHSTSRRRTCHQGTRRRPHQGRGRTLLGTLSQRRRTRMSRMSPLADQINSKKAEPKTIRDVRHGDKHDNVFCFFHREVQIVGSLGEAIADAGGAVRASWDNKTGVWQKADVATRYHKCGSMNTSSPNQTKWSSTA